MDVTLDLLGSSGLRVIEQTKKRLFSPAQKEKIKRRSLMQAGVTETSEGDNEPGWYRWGVRVFFPFKTEIPTLEPENLGFVTSQISFKHQFGISKRRSIRSRDQI